MKYALLNNERIEPQKGIKDAICPVCKELVEACCGSVRMHYWRHKREQQHCDPWWENETEWHRQWKNNFPKECQEVIHYDNVTGEKHVADVKTKTGIFLEFQHSSISPEEQYSREQFYENMIWVVDAKKDYKKFKKHIKCLKHIKSNKNYFYIDEQENCFPEKWLNPKVPVIFDFGIYDTNDYEYDIQKKWLWCIFPEKYINQYISNNIICGLCLKKDMFLNKVTMSKKFYFNITKYEFEQEKIKLDREILEREHKIEEEYRTLQKKRQELFKEKYPKEEKWRNAISKIKSDIKNNKLNPKEIFISKKGEILDRNKYNYNGKRCITLGIKSYSDNYYGTISKKNIILLLIENNGNIFSAIINLPSPILNGIWNDGGSHDYDFNCYIRTMTTSPYYDKISIWLEDEKRLWITKKLKNDLEYIKEEFSNYQI